jgi:hypothetical protein
MAVTGHYRSNTSEQPVLGERLLLVAGMAGWHWYRSRAGIGQGLVQRYQPR